MPGDGVGDPATGMLDYSQPLGTHSGWHSPPGWPPRHPKWTPPVGWQPDPSWPLAPIGWDFWPASLASRTSPRRKSYGLAVFLNLLFPGLGQLYAGVRRRAIGYLIAAAAGEILQAPGQSHRLTALAVAGKLVWFVAFIVSIGSLQKAVDAGIWRPSGRNTKLFAIAVALVSAVIAVAVTVSHQSLRQASTATACREFQRAAAHYDVTAVSDPRASTAFAAIHPADAKLAKAIHDLAIISNPELVGTVEFDGAVAANAMGTVADICG
jgi:hypothetical protein